MMPTVTDIQRQTSYQQETMRVERDFEPDVAERLQHISSEELRKLLGVEEKPKQAQTQGKAHLPFMDGNYWEGEEEDLPPNSDRSMWIKVGKRGPFPSTPAVKMKGEGPTALEYVQEGRR